MLAEQVKDAMPTGVDESTYVYELMSEPAYLK